MKIRHKFLAVMVLLCFSIIALGSLAFFQHSYVLFCILILFASMVSFFSIYMLFVRRVERLNSDLVDVHVSSSHSQKVKVESHDEISEIASRINVLLETIKLSRQQLFLLSEKNLDTNDSSLMKIHSLSSHDSGSSLPNRMQFNEAVNKAISYTKRHNKTSAILAMDLEFLNDTDSFKKELTLENIEEITSKFSNTLRQEDILVKLDGNVFIVLLHDIGKPKFASAVAEKLLHVISKEISINFSKFLLRVSIGVCICPYDASTLEEAIEKTYAALYRAKAIPGNSYQFHNPQLDEEARDYVHIKSDLQKAIEENELILHFQPKLNIKKGAIVGVEVLVRWSHPTLGLLSPAKFLEVAEDSGYIIPLGEWALREACRVNMHWQKEGYEHLNIAVNLSTKQFYDPGLIKLLSAVLNDTGLNPNYLELEINEDTIMKDLEKAAEIMKHMVSLGIQICIDHFGKGYTSIAHLKNLPISSIKIDRGFIHGIPQNPNDTAITSAIIALCHYLGISVLAEGVENADQLQFLSQQNCDMVQGYFLSYPQPVELIVKQLKKVSDRALS